MPWIKGELHCPRCQKNFVKYRSQLDCPVCGQQGLPTGIGKEFYGEDILTD